MPDLSQIITAPDAAVRNQSLESACRGLSATDLLEQCSRLDQFRRTRENLYERARALFFLYAIHRFHLPPKISTASSLERRGGGAPIPFAGYEQLLRRRFE